MREDDLLADIASRLVKSYDACVEYPLPSVNAVVSIARDIGELFFPGYRETRRVHDDAEQICLAARILSRVECRLRPEISRALEHARSISLRVHSTEATESQSAASLTARFIAGLPELRDVIISDVASAFDGDPAARTCDEIILCYPGVFAVSVYRMAHELHRLGIPYLPRILSEWAHRETGIDIHPAATIGSRFFIDHGTGVVIGETCEIGSNVTLYQGVTLGAWSFPRDEDGKLIRGEKRHPTIEDGVTIYSSASILGGSTVIGAGSQIGSGVTLSRSIPPNTIVTVEKPSLRYREAS